MNRRDFLSKAASIGVSSFFAYKTQPYVHFLNNDIQLSSMNKETRTRVLFSNIINQAKRKGWTSLSIGELMGNIGMLMLGTKYVAGTIEGEGPEICRVDLTGLDCVTFFENTLCMARILKKKKTAFDDFIAELTFTRYRKGKLTNYTSRLHYAADWIYDNEEKKVVKNITKEIGGEKFPVNLSFMSNNPNYYRALREFPHFIKTIAKIEEGINRRDHWYIPKNKVKETQKYLQTGDIIAIATSRERLDYEHTGLAYRDEKGEIRLLHASLERKKVHLDTELYKYVKSIKSHIGITVARPLHVR